MPRKNAAPSIACARCSLAFKATPRQRERAAEGVAVYCSRDCQKGANLVVLACAGCETPVTRRKADVPESGRAFCSKHCQHRTGSKPKTGRYVTCAAPDCDEQLWVKKSQEGIRRYHSPECKSRAEQRRETRTCPECETEFEARLADDTVYCSRTCYGASKRAKPGDRWVSPKTGYARLYIERDGQVVKVEEHRHVMEQIIGRPLETWETVHHKTGGFDGRSNNDPTNLELWASRHPRGHRPEDIVAYCREMLAVYGSPEERVAYADHSPLTAST